MGIAWDCDGLYWDFVLDGTKKDSGQISQDFYGWELSCGILPEGTYEGVLNIYQTEADMLAGTPVLMQDSRTFDIWPHESSLLI